MSKERLEELKGVENMLKEHLNIIKDKRLLKHAISDFDIKCLIEEVERVEELEEQNKRYREGLEDTRHELLIHYKLGGSSDNGALQIIDEALEGDSNE